MTSKYDFEVFTKHIKKYVNCIWQEKFLNYIFSDKFKNLPDILYNYDKEIMTEKLNQIEFVKYVYLNYVNYSERCPKFTEHNIHNVRCEIDHENIEFFDKIFFEIMNKPNVLGEYEKLIKARNKYYYDGKTIDLNFDMLSHHYMNRKCEKYNDVIYYAFKHFK